MNLLLVKWMKLSYLKEWMNECLVVVLEEEGRKGEFCILEI